MIWWLVTSLNSYIATLMASIWEKAISILAGNLNLGRSYHITAVILSSLQLSGRCKCSPVLTNRECIKSNLIKSKLYIDQSTSAKYKRSKSLFCIEIENLHRYTLFESGTMAAVSQINAKVFLLNLCSLRSTSKHLQASEELRILFSI